MFKFLPTPNHISQCQSFSEALLPTVQASYAARNQSNAATIIKQNTYGKLSEIAIHDLCIVNSWKCNAVDFNIYHGKNKSHSADLTIQGHPVAIKSCMAASRFPVSFMFQTDYINRIKLRPTNEILALCTVNQDFSVDVQGFLRLGDVLSKLKDPKADYLIGNKLCLYISDLKPSDWLSPNFFSTPAVTVGAA